VTPAVRIGESFAGSGGEAAHVNTVLGHQDGPAGVAWATALATPRQGFVPFVAVLRPGLPVKPLTLFVTKAAPVDPEHERLIWGAAQAGVTGGVADAVRNGVVSAGDVESHVLIAAVWVDPMARDADLVYRNNRTATAQALAAGAAGLPGLDEVLAAADSPHNPFFDGPGTGSP
jgi:5,6,7,8-tetrahydromethanopterin hydro-lyase